MTLPPIQQYLEELVIEIQLALDEEQENSIGKDAATKISQLTDTSLKIESIIKAYSHHLELREEAVKRGARINEHAQITRMARRVTKYRHDYIVIEKDWWERRLTRLSKPVTGEDHVVQEKTI